MSDIENILRGWRDDQCDTEALLRCVVSERDAAIRERDEERKRANEWLAQLHDSQRRVKVLERALAMVCRMVSLATDEDAVSIEFCELCPALDGAVCGKRCSESIREWALSAAEKEGA